MNNGAKNRQMIVAAMAVLGEGESAACLADYMSDADRPLCASLIDMYASEGNCGAKLEQLVRQIAASEKFSSLSEVHPAWILEKLRDESPRVIGIILRYLPSQHVRYIVSNMHPMLRARVPNMVESFAVQAPVLDVIRRRFESHFLPMRVSRTIDCFEFENIYYLKGPDLAELIREVGLAELAIALTGMSGQALNAACA